MANTRILKWDSDDVYTQNAEVHTRMFDMGDPHAKKKISRFHVTFTGATSESLITLKVFYRFGNNDSWMFYGVGTASGLHGKKLTLSPEYNSATDYQMEKESTGQTTAVRIKDVYVIQFKLQFFANNKVEINDYGVEYRTTRSNTISEPQV